MSQHPPQVRPYQDATTENCCDYGIVVLMVLHWRRTEGGFDDAEQKFRAGVAFGFASRIVFSGLVKMPDMNLKAFEG